MHYNGPTNRKIDYYDAIEALLIHNNQATQPVSRLQQIEIVSTLFRVDINIVVQDYLDMWQEQQTRQKIIQKKISI